MGLIEKLKSLTVLRKNYAEEIILYISLRPVLSLITNIIIIPVLRFKNMVRKGGGRTGKDVLFSSGIQKLHNPLSLSRCLHVLLVVEESIPQCLRYRVNQKIEQLEIAGYKAMWVSWKDAELAKRFIHFNHVIMFYRVPAFDNVAHLIEMAGNMNKIVMYDVDDLIFDKDIIRKKNESFGSGLSNEEKKDLVKGAELYGRALKLCPYGIGSTPALCDQISSFSGNIKTWVHRNGLDDPVLDYIEKEKTKIRRKRVTLLYGSGTRTHDHDFESVSSAVFRVFEKYPDIRLLIIGYLNLPDCFDRFSDRIDRVSFLSSESYWEILRTVDINIAPLFQEVFADCKSEIKWLEAAIFEIPSVVTGTRTYREILKDGVTGFIADTPDEWFEKLSILIESPEKRQIMGKNARQAAAGHYSPDVLAENLDSMITEAINMGIDKGTVQPVSSKKRLVYVNTLYPPIALGGATAVIKNHVDHILEKYGDEFEVFVFTGNGDSIAPYEFTQYEYDGVSVTRVNIPLGIDIDWRFKDDSLFEFFKQYIEYLQPDLIHFHCVQRLTASMLEAARKCRIPYFVTLHDSWWLCDRQFMVNHKGVDCEQTVVDPVVCSTCLDDSDASITRRRYLRRQLKNASKLLAVSRYQQALYQANSFDNVALNCNGIERPSDAMKLPGTGKLKIAYLGGICVHKGYYFFKDAVGSIHLNNSEILVVDFSLSEGQAKTKKWGDNSIRLIPSIPMDEMNLFYNDLDILVAPSLSRESFGLVTREAMVNGVWVVAADAGGLAEDIVQNENGHVFEKGNMKQLSDILTEIDSKPEDYRRKPKINDESIRFVEDQVDEVVGYYREIFEQPVFRAVN